MPKLAKRAWSSKLTHKTRNWSLKDKQFAVTYFPLSPFQIFTDLSNAALAMRRPSGEKLTWFIRAWWPGTDKNQIRNVNKAKLRIDQQLHSLFQALGSWREKRKTHASKRKNEGEEGALFFSRPLLRFFLAGPRFSLSPNYREPGTGRGSVVRAQDL